MARFTFAVLNPNPYSRCASTQNVVVPEKGTAVLNVHLEWAVSKLLEPTDLVAKTFFLFIEALQLNIHGTW